MSEQIDRPYALLDIDDSMYRGLSYLHLLHWQLNEGLINPMALLEVEYAQGGYKNMSSSRSTHEATTQNLLDIYARHLKGTSYTDIEKSTNEFYQQTDNFYDYVEPTVELLRPTHDLAIVTGEPQFIAEAVKNRFGIEHRFSTVYEIDEDGFFTGAIESSLAYRRAKINAVKPFIAKRLYEGSFAFGDSELDAEVLKSAEHAIGIMPSPPLERRMQAFQIRVDDHQSLGPAFAREMAEIYPKLELRPHDWTIISANELAINGVLHVVQKQLEIDQKNSS